ncbi:MAG: ISAs1 family transposase, partial [Janthinobacterium lividum]
MSVITLVEQLQEVDDPRCAGKVGHHLGDILVIAVCAVIACAESWEDIALYGRSKQAWLESFLELPFGIPSHDTFRRVFMLIDPDRFEAAFLSWVRGLTQDFVREVVAIDGKTIRGSFDRGREQSPLHMISAWASEQNLVLGQRCVEGKSNEITAIPALLDALELRNSIVTLDAMGCQTAIAARILDRGADYLLALKGNHGQAHKAVAEHFARTCFDVGSATAAVHDSFDDTHGRLVRRRIFASTEAASLPPLAGSPGLQSVLAVETIRSVNGLTSTTADIRYFVCSGDDTPEMLGQAIRKHWTIENSLHWVLDVTFREDHSRVRDRTAVRNLAILRKIALNLINRDTASRDSKKGRRKQAGWNDTYMRKLLTLTTHQFHPDAHKGGIGCLNWSSRTMRRTPRVN